MRSRCEASGWLAVVVRSRDSTEAPTQQYPDYSAGAAQSGPQTPIYVQAPTPPKNRGNRGAGILIALLATVATSGAVLWQAPQHSVGVVLVLLALGALSLAPRLSVLMSGLSDFMLLSIR